MQVLTWQQSFDPKCIIVYYYFQDKTFSYFSIYNLVLQSLYNISHLNNGKIYDKWNYQILLDFWSKAMDGGQYVYIR